MTGSCSPRGRCRKDCGFRPMWGHYAFDRVRCHSAVEELPCGQVGQALPRAQLPAPVSQGRGEPVPAGAWAQVRPVRPGLRAPLASGRDRQAALVLKDLPSVRGRKGRRACLPWAVRHRAPGPSDHHRASGQGPVASSAPAVAGLQAASAWASGVGPDIAEEVVYPAA